MPFLLSRRTLVGAVAGSLLCERALATPLPAVIAGAQPIGRQRMLVVSENPGGRIVAFDSSAYAADNPTDGRDVVIFGSYCGTLLLAPFFARGVRAVIGTDGGIGKDDSGISGLAYGERIGVPVAAIAARSAETSNGRSTLLGRISRANAHARALGVHPGQLAWEAARRLSRAPMGRPAAIPAELAQQNTPAVVVEQSERGRIWAAPGTASFHEPVPGDVICSGSNASRVMSDGVLRAGAKGVIANDAGIGLHNSAVEGVFLLGDLNIAAAAVASRSARMADGASTWNDGIISVCNAPAARLGIRRDMTAKAAARLMLRG